MSEYASLRSHHGVPMMLQGVSLRGQLRGLLLDMQMEQRFSNSSGSNVELVYSFPLPLGAVLLHLEVQLGEQWLRGLVVEKQQAEQRYEEALSEGHSAVMLERNADYSYTLNLGNLGPEESCVIRLRYCQTLQFEQGGLRLLIPTVIAPRYGDPQRGGLLPHQVPEYALDAHYPFSIELQLYAELAQAQISAPNHAISISALTDQPVPCVQVQLVQQGALDRDFVLVLQQLSQTGLSSAGYDYLQPQRVAVLASFYPQLPVHAESIAVKVLVDCSGSMTGDSIEAAKRALQSIVQQLGEQDRFSLSRFGTQVQHQTGSLRRVNPKATDEALAWIAQLDSNMGGTNMELALASTFKLTPEVASDVLLITDGEISEIDQLIATAERARQRVFVVGIGSSPAEAHLRRLAAATGGACDFVSAGEQTQPAVLRMFHRLRSPRAQHLQLQWPVPPLWQSLPTQALFDGDTLNVFALFEQAPQGEVQLLGCLDNAPAELQPLAQVLLSAPSADEGILARMAAAQRVRELSQEQARPWVLDYQLVSEYSNFLLVQQRAEGEQFEQLPTLHKVAQMLPAGWGGVGSARGMARACCAPAAAASLADLDMDFSIDVEPPAPKVLPAPAPSLDSTPPELDHDQASLSPLQLREWLLSHPIEQWPHSLGALRGLGVTKKRLLGWLTQLSERYAAESVIAAFLYVIATHDFPGQHKPLGLLRQLRSRLASGLGSTQLIRELRAGLVDMNHEDWD